MPGLRRERSREISLCSIGNLIAAANQSAVIAGMAQPDARGSYFGVSAIALAVGGSVGTLVGSALYGASMTSGMPAVPWLVIGGVGALSTAGFWLRNIPSSSGVISVERHTTPEVQQWN